MSHVVLATAGYDHAIRFWEATSGICYRTLPYPYSQVNRLECTSDKTRMAAAGNPRINIYDVDSMDPAPLHTYDGHDGNVTAVGFQKDTQWLFSGPP
jgi:G protein beta subunit-like protein